MGRPRKKIDQKQVEMLASIQCSYEEMGAVLDCSPDTLERRFAGVIKKARETGKSSLKRRQFTLAMAGNATMLIWLGKIVLGQRETMSHELSGPGGAPIPIEVDDVRSRIAGRIAGLASRIAPAVVNDTNGSNGNGKHR